MREWDPLLSPLLGTETIWLGNAITMGGYLLIHLDTYMNCKSFWNKKKKDLLSLFLLTDKYLTKVFELPETSSHVSFATILVTN